ncbi:hypothetical protein GCM10011390_30480 [Aureimonas endophytica]|uniref:Uncharacterized protein n=1 Tax=Aureimonas endophytica TaxID=2027858 RepID=A0A917E8D4_9HYPH|nr:hypothetical protein [Aureimonas endophytica]GGE09298.1 hypothetical protein GCM10011390_30480 [Aureimonas endophytica]
MTSYREAAMRQSEAVGTRIVTATELDMTEDHPLRSKRYVPLLPNWCVCVTEPCRCETPDGPIVWVPQDAIRSREATGRSNRSGEPLQDFHLEDGATLISEAFIRVRADHLPLLRRAGGSRRAEGGERPAARAPGFTYAGQHCHDEILYDSWMETDASDNQTYHCVPIGSCV